MTVPTAREQAEPIDADRVVGGAWIPAGDFKQERVFSALELDAPQRRRGGGLKPS